MPPPSSTPPTGPNKPSAAGKSSAPAGARSSSLVASSARLPQEDLTQDKLLSDLPRDDKGRPTLDRIPLVCRIGRGGMGAVYYAVHPRLQVHVAIKILPFHLVEQDPKLVDRFVSEARMAAALSSDHLVRVLDVDHEQNTHFLVMEYVAGDSAGGYLKRLRAEGKPAVPEAEALEIVTAATRGLDFAHKAGIIHRDIKPDNILLPNNELRKAKLADLGLAKPQGQAQTMGTMANVAMGTPGYMAPEQIEDARSAGPPADVFSMGATLYALLAGNAPFAGTSLGVVLRDTAIKEPPPLPPTVSAGTRAIVARCLAKDPAQRYADATELLAALEGGRGAPAEPTLAPMRTTAVTPKKGGAGALIGVAVVVLLLAIGGAAFFLLRGKGGEDPKPQPKPPVGETDEEKRKREEQARKEKEERERREAAARVEQVLADASKAESESRFDDALAVLARGDADEPRIREAKARIEQRIAAARSGDEKRTTYRLFLNAAESAQIAAEVKDTPEVWDKVMEACAKAEANAQGDAELKAVRDIAATAQQRKLWAAARELEGKGDLDGALKWLERAIAAREPPKALADYRETLETKRKTIADKSARKREFDARAGKARAEQDAAAALALWRQAAEFADDPADRKEAADAAGRLEAEVAKAEAERRFRDVLKSANDALAGDRLDDAEARFKDALGLRPDDGDAKSGLARVAEARRRKAYDAAMAEARKAEEGKQWAAAKAAYARALEARPGDAAAAQALDAIKRRTSGDQTLAHPAGVAAVAFSPDGKWLVTAALDGTMRLWDAEVGQEVRRVGDNVGFLRSVAFSPDGKRAVSGGGGAVRISDVETGKEIRALSADTLFPVAWGGTRVACSSKDFSVLLVSGDSGEGIGRLKGHSNDVRALVFSSDGKRLVSASDDKTVRMWDAEKGTQLWSGTGHSGRVYGLAWSPDGKKIASSGLDKTIRIWDAQTGTGVRAMVDHTDGVTSLAFAPDGRLASASRDKAVRIWNAQTGECLRTIEGHTAVVHAVAWNHDGTMLASGSDDNTARVWRVR